MDKTQITDELLYQYMPLAGEEILKELEQETDRTYIFSDKFDRKMKKLMRREAHPQRYAALSVAKKAAIVFVGAVVVFMTVTMSTKAYRTKFFETIRTFGEDFVEYEYSAGTDNAKLVKKLVPAYIPEGYVETKREIGDYCVQIIYEKRKGEAIYWRQLPATNTTVVVIDSEYDEKTVIDINGGTLEIQSYHSGFVGAYYEKNNYIILFNADNLSVEEVQKIFECAEEIEEGDNGYEKR